MVDRYIYLIRINFYPEEEDRMFAGYNNSISEELTDDILAIRIYKNGDVRIVIES
jgi:hypothetical protein